MVFNLTKWPVQVSVQKDERLLTKNLRQGFVELSNDGEASFLRISYLEGDEERLERECVQIADLQRAEDTSNLTFRICKLKSGLDCNEHVLIKPERSKHCHSIFYAFRYLKQTPERGIQKSAAQKQSTSAKQTLVKQVPAFRQISVTQRAYDLRKLAEIKYFEKISSSKNGKLKRKGAVPTSAALCSPTKKQQHELEKEQKKTTITNKSVEVEKPEKGTDGSNGAVALVQKNDSSVDLSASFERLSAGADRYPPKGFLNLGNSCYMNAVLQGLFHIEAFEDLLHEVPESSEHTEETFLDALRRLRDDYQKATVAQKRHLLGNDAQEFLIYMLNKVDHELSSQTNNISPEKNGLTHPLMSSIFGFELVHKIICKKCNYKQNNHEEGMSVPIQIMNDDMICSVSPSLQMLLDNCLKDEEVEYICPKCFENSATLSHEFQSLPRCLILFLKRYEFKRSATRQKELKRRDTVELSMCIRLVRRDDVEQLNYLMLFCRPQRDFYKRACGLLNIRYRPSRVWQRSKPLLQKSVPSHVAPIAADGNCLFRSIAFYLAGSDEEHLMVRRSVVKFEEKYGDRFRDVTEVSPDKWKEHVSKMANDGQWGTEIELLASAVLLDAEIWTFLSGKWFRYRPLYKIENDGVLHELPLNSYKHRENVILLSNDNFHYRPVLDITCSEKPFQDYQLASVISHQGTSLSSGHYVCDVRNRKKETWLHFDDNRVVERSQAKVLNDCARDGYIFFYVADN